MLGSDIDWNIVHGRGLIIIVAVSSVCSYECVCVCICFSELKCFK